MDAKQSRTADERRFTQMEGRLPVGMSSCSSDNGGAALLRRLRDESVPASTKPDEQELIPTGLRRFMAAPFPLAPNAKPRTLNAKRYAPCLGKNCVR
jgi:hypothetical protein